MKNLSLLAIVLLILTLNLAGCSSAYYGLMETFGSHKRDILVSRVVSARDEQLEAKNQFKDALGRFKEVVKVEPSELESRYNQLKSDLYTCEARAKDVHNRIEGVEEVAEALFSEWQGEMAQYSSAELRRLSEEKLRATRARYEQLISAMKQAESKMEPVLRTFRDQVLFLKHNLNAQAIASLQGSVRALESEVQTLISDMERSIEQANSFIDAMGKTQS